MLNRPSVCLLKLRKLLFVRHFSAANQDEVRVRFAPSPTGFLHLGGLRTALYNYLFAKSRRGKFILRIEDTDQSRLVAGASDRLESDLAWAGIVPDESPRLGGSCGPYTQSERLHLYRSNVEVLLEKGAAYHCFCSDKRLDLLRRETLRLRQVPKYDNRCRHLSPSEVDRRLAQGEEHCVRFKLGAENVAFDDLVYGRAGTENGQQEGDPVVMKTDGYPTYHLANVVDDRLMGITHVLRGVEWQISTQKHLQLYRALDWAPPQFAHLPLIMNADGTKLSKRQGDVRIEHYRTDDIFPLALVNYVTNAGGGFHRPSTKPCIYTLDQLAEQFDLALVNTNSCRLTPERLVQFNALELERLMEKEGGDVLVKRVRATVLEAFKAGRERGTLQLQDEHIRSVLSWSSKRIQRLGDLVKPDLAFLWVVPAQEGDAAAEFHGTVLEELLGALERTQESDFDRETLKAVLKAFSVKHDVPFNKLMKFLRHSLSGLKEGPGVAEMMSILGRASTLARLRRIK